MGASGVRVNAVAPGWIASSGFDTYPPRSQRSIRALQRHVPLQRFGTEAEVSAAIVFLLSPAAGFISGARLRVDGAAPNAKRHVDARAARPLPALERLPPLRSPQAAAGGVMLRPACTYVRHPAEAGPRHSIDSRARNEEACVGCPGIKPRA